MRGVSLKKVENQSAAGRKVAMSAVQAGQLLLDFEQMLKRPERNDDEPKRDVQIEIRHVSALQLNAAANFILFACELGAAAR